MRKLFGGHIGVAIACLTLCLAYLARAGEEPYSPQLNPLAFLADHCWIGPFADGKGTDEHCYEWMYGGKFLRDRHIVRGGAKPYRGETLYYWDGAENAIAYIYLNSDGGVSQGLVKVDGETLTFPAERYTEGDTTREFGTTWVREGEDRYVAVTSELKDGRRHVAWRVDYRRGGPTSAADWLD